MLQNAPLGAFCNTVALHKAIISLENQFLVFFEWPFYTGFYCMDVDVFQDLNLDL